MSQIIIEGKPVSKQNLTQIVGIWWGIMFFACIAVTLAQDTTLQSDIPLTVTIGETPVWLTYEGTANDIISISTLSQVTETKPDTILEILTPSRLRLDYADDASESDDSIQSDATLSNIKLPIDGEYQIRVDSFNGVQAGEIKVMLTRNTMSSEMTTVQGLTIIRGDIGEYGRFTHMLDVTANTSLTISARDVSGTLDPILSVYDIDNKLIAFNDDHQGDDLEIDVLDAKINELQVKSDMTISIVVRDFMGRNGTIELIISS